PISYGGQENFLQLHVFKDGKKSAGGSEISSALIALDTAAMGRFETYVQKNSRAINCQFRLENDEIVRAVRENIHKLDALLRAGGYSLEHFSFLPPDEPYNLLKNPAENSAQPFEKLSHFDVKA
ncbi:MAG: flagellar hook-length control protein FliK, partial [Defluviitaleaceae bacterium]|nr:flagellar hook-length control protein FliK [Defluviitaleaceae bacterium]